MTDLDRTRSTPTRIAAREHLESLRWPNGPVCPHCGAAENIAKARGREEVASGGSTTATAAEQFTVTVGTVFERTKSRCTSGCWPTTCSASSKKGMSTHQLHRMLGVTYKTAWFMAHRIRESMRETKPEGLGGAGKWSRPTRPTSATRNRASPQAHEARQVRPVRQACGARPGRARRQGPHHPHRRGQRRERRQSRAPQPVARERADDRREPALHQGRRGVRPPSDASTIRADEYVRDEVHTNTIEGYFSVFKRGMQGIYQHCGEAAPAPLPGRVRFPLQHPHQAWLHRCHARRAWRSTASAASV